VSTPTPRGINETDVWQAADALLLEGARPTIERVRMKIGRGSPNTVSPHLDTWFRSLGARIVDPKAFSAPPTLPDVVNQAATHVWEAAMAAARSEAAAVLDSERAELAQARHNLAAQSMQLKATEEKTMAQAQGREEALKVMRAQIGEMVERLNHALTEMEAREKLIAELRVEIAELLQDRESIRRRWDADRSSYDSDRRDSAAKDAAQSAHWAIEVDRARQALRINQEQRAKVEKDLAGQARDLSARLKESEHQARENSDLHAHTLAELDKLQPKHAAAMDSLEELRLRFKDRETQWAEQVGLLQTQIANALAQLAAKDQEHGVLLRSLVANSASPPVRRSSRRPRAPS